MAVEKERMIQDMEVLKGKLRWMSEREKIMGLCMEGEEDEGEKDELASDTESVYEPSNYEPSSP
jgi:hypothetical protein